MPSKVKALSLAVLLGFSGSVWAGLGSMKVSSRLNEPFYAVIPLTGQTASDATEPSLSSQQDSVRFSIQGSSSSNRLDFKVVRKKKQAYVQVRSSDPIQDPILTFSVKVSSASGTVARQYSAILDPRGYPAPSSNANSGTVSNPKTSGSVKAPRQASKGRTVYVQEDDTLTSIAARFKPARMSLANVKRAIFLANKKAFVNGNPSLIKKGATIQVPTEARMRSLLAKATPKRTRSVAKSSTGGGTAVTPVATDNKDLADLQRQLVQAKERIQKLEKELESAKRNAGSTANTAVPPPAEVKVPEPVVEVSVPKVEDPKPTEISSAEVISGTEEPISGIIGVETEASEEGISEVVPSEEEISAVVEPPVIVKPPVVDPPPVEKTFVEGLLDDPIMLGAGAGGLLLVLGGIFYIIRKRRKGSSAAAGDDDEGFESGDTFFSMNDDTEAGGFLGQAPGVGGSAKAPVVATPNVAAPNHSTPPKNSGGGSGGDAASTFMSDFTRMSAAIDSVEIDPLSEAEVYIAYGRTDEAEEILTDALAKDPAQHEVRKKLLEIYAGKQDVTTFNSMAKELYNAFDGRGALWQEVAEMGAKLDPSNPMYNEMGGISPAVAPKPAVPANIPPPPQEEADLDFSGLGGLDDNQDLDFSGFGNAEEKVNNEEGGMLAFDLPPTSVEVSSIQPSSQTEDDSPFAMDFSSEDLGIHTDATSTFPAFSGVEPSGEAGGGSDLAFDLDAVLSDAQESGNLGGSLDQQIDFSGSESGLNDLADLDNMNFGMDSSENMFSLEETPLTDSMSSSESDPLAAKLELARVYLDMGDADGAKEALIELLEETQNPALRAEATQMLGDINS